MALTVAQVGTNTVLGNKKATVSTITFDAAYTTGGLALDPSQVGLAFIDFLVADGADGYNVVYDYATGKLKAFGSTAGTEVAADVDLHLISCRVLAVGA